MRTSAETKTTGLLSYRTFNVEARLGGAQTKDRGTETSKGV